MVAYKINGETLYRRTLYQFCVHDLWYLSKQEKWIDEQQEEYKGALAVYKEYENEKTIDWTEAYIPAIFQKKL